MLHQSNDKTLESNANKDANSSRILIDNSASKEKSFVSKTKLNSILDSILKPSNSLPLDQELTKEIDKNAISVEHEMATISIPQPRKESSIEEQTEKEDPRKPIIIEYYDLPYRYDNTIVKVLAQNPNTLFVYWEISDADRSRFIEQYGPNFFNETKPVLLIKNLTDDYVYELEINDFANNWYIHVNDSKCRYSIELGRRPKDSSNDNYIHITYSNVMESPNDHVLFFKEGDKLVFKNIATNKLTTRIYTNGEFGNDLKTLYKDYHLENGRFDYRNPSSQNPTSNVM